MLRLKLFVIIALGLFWGCGGDDDGDGLVCLMTTPLPPDVSGTWILSDPTLGSSTCPANINDAVLNALSFLEPCAVEVEQAGNQILATDCDRETLAGCVDADGIISATQLTSDSEQGCTLSAAVEFIADSGESESTASFVFPLRFSGNCAAPSACEIVIDAAWTRALGATVGAGSGGASCSAAAIVRSLAESLRDR